MTAPLLQVAGLETFYGASQALFGMSLTVEAGAVTAMIGRNGMGKTTTIRSIMGLTPARSGEIRFDGARIDGAAPHVVARRGVGFAPEGRQVFPNLTTTENLIATAAQPEGRGRWRLETVLELFPALVPRRNAMATLLSGGEQQMLAIGRALMTNPKLLILDEATEGLAPLVRAEIWRALAELKRDGLSILIVDKNVADLAGFADHMVVVEKGAAAWSGAPDALLADPALLNRYLGLGERD